MACAVSGLPLFGEAALSAESQGGHARELAGLAAQQRVGRAEREADVKVQRLHGAAVAGGAHAAVVRRQAGDSPAPGGAAERPASAQPGRLGPTVGELSSTRHEG